MAAAIVGDIDFDNIGHLAAASQIQGDLADDIASDGKFKLIEGRLGDVKACPPAMGKNAK